MKRLYITKNPGFCFGVKRAVDMAQGALAEEGVCYSLGQIIHNNSVTERLESEGLVTVRSAEDVPGGVPVILRSHGAEKQELERLVKKGAKIYDATCPRVKKIHKIVSEASEKGRTVIIIGASEHPEVRAIRTWCGGESFVFADADELEAGLVKNPRLRGIPLTVVIQTTQYREKLENCSDVLKKQCTKGEVFDTICDATFLRQDEARDLSKRCDAMLVIGDKHSANSVHLAQICSEHCENVIFIESAQELETNAFNGADTIGIATGASAPSWVIKEVIQKMCDEMDVNIALEEQVAEPAAAEAEETAAIISAEENVPENTLGEAPEEAADADDAVEAAPDSSGADEVPVKPDSEKTFEELLEDSIRTIYNGETVTGVVAAITPTEVSVDLGAKYSGYIPHSEFIDDPNVRIEDVVHIGEKIEEAQSSGEPVEGVVKEDNKGGVVVSVNGVRIFVPASQTGIPKDSPMSQLIGQKVRLKITEVNRSRRRVVGSIRAVLNKERRERSEKIWNEIEVGKRYVGTVKSLTSFGAFVDIGGIDGMVHVSELSWSRIKQPSEVLSVGQEAEVYVIGFDKENRRISLGYKDPEANPWKLFTTQFRVDDIAKVKIVKLMPFGAFAEIMPRVDGLIHISQIADRRIGKPDEVLTVGDELDAKIIGIDDEKQKVSLSIRALSEPAHEERNVPVENREDAMVYSISETGVAQGLSPDEEEDI